jgi:hypothetical protein
MVVCAENTVKDDFVILNNLLYSIVEWDVSEKVFHILLLIYHNLSILNLTHRHHHYMYG